MGLRVCVCVRVCGFWPLSGVGWPGCGASGSPPSSGKPELPVLRLWRPGDRGRPDLPGPRVPVSPDAPGPRRWVHPGCRSHAFWPLPLSGTDAGPPARPRRRRGLCACVQVSWPRCVGPEGAALGEAAGHEGPWKPWRHGRSWGRPGQPVPGAWSRNPALSPGRGSALGPRPGPGPTSGDGRCPLCPVGWDPGPVWLETDASPGPQPGRRPPPTRRCFHPSGRKAARTLFL